MVRALVIGSATALVAGLAGGPLIDLLRRLGVGKAISEEGPESHRAKAGTPTMGGLLILGTLAVVSVATNLVGRQSILLPLGVMALAAAVGLADDVLTLQGRERIGGHERGGLVVKALLGAGLGLIAGLLVYYPLDVEHVSVPHFGAYHWPAALAVLVSIAVVGATTSAGAVSDGLDGLLAGLMALSYGAFGVIAGVQGQAYLATFCFTVVGALAGFLWYNAHPARVFLGEVGALPLSAGLGTVALMTGWWLVLPVVAAVLVAELLSDILQIGSFRLTGRRVFKMAPLHHHFELAGWPEPQVVVRFWLAGLVGAILGVALVLTD
jgi:phospho-N-acetylmuramoyl-pentapeptide-transferase